MLRRSRTFIQAFNSAALEMIFVVFFLTVFPLNQSYCSWFLLIDSFALHYDISGVWNFFKFWWINVSLDLLGWRRPWERLYLCLFRPVFAQVFNRDWKLAHDSPERIVELIWGCGRLKISLNDHLRFNDYLLMMMVVEMDRFLAASWWVIHCCNVVF